MRISRVVLCLVVVLIATANGQGLDSSKPDKGRVKSVLDAKIEKIELTDAILRDGLSELSLKSIDGFHIGFEEIIRETIQDNPTAVSSHFTLQLQRKTVREILDALCESDARYTWSQDGDSINVYPRAAREDLSYLLGLKIERITVSGIPDPDQGLTPLSKLFPEQQLGYASTGGDDTYAEPWTAQFERLTVRQFINRIAEHLGPRTSWIWQGGKDERMFTFIKGGFNHSASSLVDKNVEHR